MSAESFISQGGPIMYVLLGMSVVGVAIVVLKFIQFVRMGVGRYDFVEMAFAHIERDDAGAAIKVLNGRRNPIASVMKTAIRCGLDPTMPHPDSESEIARVGSLRVREMESLLRILSSIAHLAPICGLLGTVTGMIQAFMNLQTAGTRVDPAVLSGGIWEALLTTAFGLAIAIPSMAAYFYFEGEVDKVRAVMKDTSIRVLVHYRKSRIAQVLDEGVLERARQQMGGDGGV